MTPMMLAGLEATAILGRDEIAQIETGHATKRRLLLARSIQSKRMDLEALNADVVSRALRKDVPALGRQSGEVAPKNEQGSPN